MNDLINKLPGQPDANFRQFTGYIDVDENVDGRSLFYYFVEAEKDPMTQPLTVWLTGGPGCSSVGDGFSSVGPFVVTKDAHGLQKNLFSWNKGHFIPNLADALLDDNKQFKQSKFNLKGLVLGNPMLRSKLDDLAKFDLFFSQKMINSSLYKQIKKECNVIDEDNYFFNLKAIWSATCENLMERGILAAFKTDANNYFPLKLFDIFRDPCAENEQDLNVNKQAVKLITEVDMCSPFRAQCYFNLPEVQRAFHGNRTKLSYKWKGCFTGDQDAIIPTVGTLQHLKKLAEELNIKLTKEEAWSFRNQEGGLKYDFGDLLTFLTVKGGYRISI
ncbi:serine carboxypeptidase-like 44 [Gossypium hirsutum]|uniref:Serine carboxypeptidase-like 44 n=1 Tax=Gossypium hirsutum TaxID=3635 RepID=A0ABM3BIQ4_GOSHI|nr:serine carboxypeptidase-like 44 [Gossypium hirsutum]